MMRLIIINIILKFVGTIANSLTVPLMAGTLFFKCHSVGLQVQNYAAREAFPTRVTQGYYRTLGEA
jgi:hypothetical protein